MAGLSSSFPTEHQGVLSFANVGANAKPASSGIDFWVILNLLEPRPRPNARQGRADLKWIEAATTTHLRRRKNTWRFNLTLHGYGSSWREKRLCRRDQTESDLPTTYPYLSNGLIALNFASFAVSRLLSVQWSFLLNIELVFRKNIPLTQII